MLESLRTLSHEDKLSGPKITLRVGLVDFKLHQRLASEYVKKLNAAIEDSDTSSKVVVEVRNEWPIVVKTLIDILYARDIDKCAEYNDEASAHLTADEMSVMHPPQQPSTKLQIMIEVARLSAELQVSCDDVARVTTKEIVGVLTPMDKRQELESNHIITIFDITYYNPEIFEGLREFLAKIAAVEYVKVVFAEKAVQRGRRARAVAVFKYKKAFDDDIETQALVATYAVEICAGIWGHGKTSHDLFGRDLITNEAFIVYKD
ncbi:hypothetical protein EAE99_011299 [Botrytis elliptica]|nr:hypothetical protein EAE99_011299 [Botrytis elliptica]